MEEVELEGSGEEALESPEGLAPVADEFREVGFGGVSGSLKRGFLKPVLRGALGLVGGGFPLGSGGEVGVLLKRFVAKAASSSSSTWEGVLMRVAEPGEGLGVAVLTIGR